MSWPSLAGLVLLAACGFAPALDGSREGVTVEAPATPDGYTLRARLEERLGAGPRRLDVTPALSEQAAAVTDDGAITRYALRGEARWRLSEAGGATLSEGVVRETAGYSATGSTVAVRAAERDARARLMTALADAVAARLTLR